MTDPLRPQSSQQQPFAAQQSRSQPHRPPPDRRIGEQLRDWVAWFGAGRLVATSVAIVAVVAGGYWLVRPPAVPTEQKLPFASDQSISGAPTTSMPFVGIGSSSTVQRSDQQVIVVHIAGAVVLPGVYRMQSGDRVDDAVRLAGGFVADADLDAVNLAALLGDGQRVYLPRVGETVPAVVAGGASSAAPQSSAVGPIDLNSATTQQLETLPGIGPATAQAIVGYRDQHGPFASVNDLGEVRGLGPAKLEALRGLVTV